MLFNSYSFIFLFLPVLLCLWWQVATVAPARLPLLLLAASLVFYGLWGLPFLCLLLVMVLVNYAFGMALALPPEDIVPDAKGAAPNMPQSRKRKALLAVAVTVNLLPLCWFKYAGFIIENINALCGAALPLPHTGLPLGISFYTFLQIAWLVTVYRGQTAPQGLGMYALFATCFPYVISGPIVRWQHVGGQFARLRLPRSADVLPALGMFVLGLGKKVLLADTLAVWANSIFNAAEKGFPLSAGEAWVGSLAYTFQLYFDFSGYTDMAIGVALLLGIRLPDNFDSPYKSTGIVDFWRRWHITLSTWLRDFLYIPLGGSRAGRLKQYRNLFVTMLLGGVWHGAGWPFIVWGALHGAMLSVNHFFRAFVQSRGGRLAAVVQHPVCRIFSIFITFLCINAAWVVFRANTMHGASRIYEALAQGLAGGLFQNWDGLFPNHYVQDWQPLLLLALCFGIVWCLPNARQIIFGNGEGRPAPWLRWRVSASWAAGLGVLAFASLVMLSRQSVFLYFQF